MIAQAGLLSYRMGFQTPLAKTQCTQRCDLPVSRLTAISLTRFNVLDSEQTKYMSHGERR